MTRVLQSKNQISDAGAAGLGEGLKVNSSLQELSLVRLFDFCLFFVGAIQGVGGEGVGWNDACVFLLSPSPIFVFFGQMYPFA